MNKPRRNYKMAGVKNLNSQVSFTVHNDEEREQLHKALFPPKKYTILKSFTQTARLKSRSRGIRGEKT